MSFHRISSRTLSFNQRFNDELDEIFDKEDEFAFEVMHDVNDMHVQVLKIIKNIN